MLALLVPAAESARAELIARESFDYAATNVAHCNGGEGWQGAWFGSPLNARDNAVTTGGLAHASLAAAGGKMIENGGDIRSFRRIDTSGPALAGLLDEGASGKALGRDDTTIWIAFLIACDSYPVTAYGGIHLCDGLGDLNQDKFGDKRSHQRISMGRQNNDPHWYLGRVTNGGPGKGAWASPVTADRTVRLLVYRFDFKKGPEEAWMWIDPPLDAEPPASNAVVHADTVEDFRFNTLSAGAGGASRFLLDEIRIGTTFADVAPRRRETH